MRQRFDRRAQNRGIAVQRQLVGLSTAGPADEDGRHHRTCRPPGGYLLATGVNETRTGDSSLLPEGGIETKDDFHNVAHDELIGSGLFFGQWRKKPNLSG